MSFSSSRPVPEIHAPCDPPILRLFTAVDASLQTLRHFFDSWFMPEVLQGESVAASSTVVHYLDALVWWERLTNDPPLCEITRDTLKDFRAALRTATFARSPLHGAKRYPLSKSRQVGILRDIRAIVYRTGPELDGKRECAEILDRAPHIAIEAITGTPKPTFSLERLRKLAKACSLMTQPRIQGLMAPAWCYAMLASYSFTGLRRESVRLVQWPMFAEREDGIWLHVPPEIVPKTSKPTDIAVHPEMWSALCAIRTDSNYVLSIDRLQTRKRRTSDPQTPWLSGERIADLLNDLQRLAGIPEAQWLTPQAWRRTHLDLLDECGYAQSRKMLQEAADHADSKTTEGSYVDVKNKFRRRLPWLRTDLEQAYKDREKERLRREEQALDSRQQRLFD